MQIAKALRTVEIIWVFTSAFRRPRKSLQIELTGMLLLSEDLKAPCTDLRIFSSSANSSL